MSEIVKPQFEEALRHLFDSSDNNIYDKNIINLSIGAPGPDLLSKCCDIFEKATRHRMNIESKTNSLLFQYGATIGSYEARTELSLFLSENYQSKVFSENLVITSGATNGLHLILSTLLDMNGVIFVDSVTYMIALDCFRQFTNLKIIPVQLNDDGVDIDHLTKEIIANKFVSKTKMFWGMYYAIPTFHNPTGILFSESICRDLIKLARKHDLLITCDDVYNFLHYHSDGPTKRLFAYDDYNSPDYKGNVISNGSFSKIIAPGLRLGWLECPLRCANVFFNNCGILKSGGCVNQYISGIMTSLLQLGLAQVHIDMAIPKYKERMLAVNAVLRKNLPKSCKFIEPKGGYFVWIEFPKNIDSTLLNDFMREKYKIYAMTGERFSYIGQSKNFIRLSIAFHSKNILEDATKKFCSAVKEYCNINSC